MARVSPRDNPIQRTSIPNKLLSLFGFWNADTDANDKIAAQDLIDDILGTIPAETDANTAYKDRVKTKVLWTGPLSVVSTPTSLDGGEKFSDWDYVFIDVNLISDVNMYDSTSFKHDFNTDLNRFYSDTGNLRFKRLTDTTFEMNQKTLAAGNISRIIGISL